MTEISKVLISICIPAYNRTEFLKRLLESIKEQTFKDFEVIVSDDSPGNEVEGLCQEYMRSFSIQYFKNEKALGTPENWNAAIRQASGEWIKIMHDDDWFSHAESLAAYSSAIEQNPGAQFFFSAYANVYEGSNKKETIFVNRFRWQQMIKDPVTLLANNIIGPPSVTLHKNHKKYWYDAQIKWVVDMDFYIRFFESTQPVYIDKVLVNVGVNSTQVTTYTFGVPEIHLRESLYLLNKTGEKHLHNLLVFDAWWRLLRNFGVKNEQALRDTGYTGKIPAILSRMVGFQQKLPAALLKKGVLSKVFMTLCYFKNKNAISLTS